MSGFWCLSNSFPVLTHLHSVLKFLVFFLNRSERDKYEKEGRDRGGHREREGHRGERKRSRSRERHRRRSRSRERGHKSGGWWGGRGEEGGSKEGGKRHRRRSRSKERVVQRGQDQQGQEEMKKETRVLSIFIVRSISFPGVC